MPKPKKTNADDIFDNDNKLEHPNFYLRTEKEHKDWYSPHYQGKSRGRPWTGAAPKAKKSKKK